MMTTIEKEERRGSDNAGRGINKNSKMENQK